MAAALSPSPIETGTARTARRRDSVGVALVLAVLLAACGHLLIKYGLNAAVRPAPDATLPVRVLGYLFAPGVLPGLAVYGIGTLLWIVIVSKRDISYLYPISSVNYVLLALGGMWLFHEPVSLARWMGIFVVMIGVAVLQMSGGKAKS